MTRYTIFLGLIFCFESCSDSIVSKEQRDRYDNCRQTLIESKKYTDQIPKDAPTNDSTKQFYNDICSLTLDELVKKYNLSKDQIDPTINSICNSSDIINSFKNLDNKLRLLDSNFSTIDDSLNNLEINIDKIDSKAFNKSDYVIVGDDTLKLKVAAYDSLDDPKRNKKKKNP